MNTTMSGRERRAFKRSFDPKAFTRKQAEILVKGTDDLELIGRFQTHPNKHVQKRACQMLEFRKQLTEVQSEVEAVKEEIVKGVELVKEMIDPNSFDALVARFTAEGKADPVKSARASIARRAQMTKKKDAAVN